MPTRSELAKNIQTELDRIQRIDLTQAEIKAAMAELIEHAHDTLWLTDTETVFERLAYLYEVAGGERKDLVLEWPEYFDIDVVQA